MDNNEKKCQRLSLKGQFHNKYFLFLFLGRYPIPPYWSLGFQICRFGYWYLSHMREAKNRQLKNGIPIDGQCADIDTQSVLGHDFTLTKR